MRAARCWPVAGSQIRTVPSSLPLASQVPSGAIATALTGSAQPLSSWLVRTARCWPVAGSQIRTDPVRPVPPLASQVPSGAIATAITASRVAGEDGALLAGGRVPDPHRPVVPPPPLASQVPSGAIATAPHPAGVAGEDGALLAGDRVPDPHRPVVAGAGQPGAVRGDRHRPHQAVRGR